MDRPHHLGEPVTVARATASDLDDWLSLRDALWPQERETQEAEARTVLENPEQTAFIARDATGIATGFAEVALRHDYVNGCETSPVGFLEGIYVIPKARRQGVARALMEACAQWVRERGCTELASDAVIDNDTSHKMHAALGFTETERVVYFRRRL